MVLRVAGRINSSKESTAPLLSKQTLMYDSGLQKTNTSITPQSSERQLAWDLAPMRAPTAATTSGTVLGISRKLH
jgi:hypothetical protein